MPFGRLLVALATHLLLFVALFALVTNRAFLTEASQPAAILGWALFLGLPLSLFEYLYHRYLLHSAVLPFMAVMHRSHTTHHGLTSVKAPVNPKEPARLVEVSSTFPVEEEHQEAHMMFPLYSLSIFIPVFLILFALPLKLLFPASPIVLSTIFAVVLYYAAYEIWHAILHLPFERFWMPRMEGQRTGRLFRRMYGFHLMHHWRPSSNLAIVGFWGVALWDHAFRTHRRPERLPIDGREVSYHDARLAKPLWPISQLDRWQAGLYRGSRTFERFLIRVFLRRRTH